jgi:predicted O-methyltransferase YrrM
MSERWRRHLKPIPAEWRAAKERLQSLRDFPSLYHFAEEHFGISQVVVEIKGLLDAVASAHPKVVGEIGVRKGGNSFLFTQVFDRLELLFDLDLMLQNTEQLSFYAKPAQKIEFLAGSSYAPQTVSYVKRLLRGKQFDFLFIDGDHSYNGVAQDFLSYYETVRPGGLIALHDIVPDDVAKHGKASANTLLYGGEVYLLWRRIKPFFKHQEFVQSWDQGGFGIGLLTKPDVNELPSDVRNAIEQPVPVTS